MGMIWNSADTLAMINMINDEFSTNIAKWQGLRGLFDHKNSGNMFELKNIASSNNLFGGNSAGSSADQKWQAWLGLLGKSFDTANSGHEKLRKAIYDGLDSSRYDSIFFQVVPLAHGNRVKVSTYPDDDDRLMGVLIETPTVAAVKATARQQAKARRRARTAAKAKNKKKS